MTEREKALKKIFRKIQNHESNAWAKKLGYDPVYSAYPTAKIMLVGQAPGRKAQESGKPWNDLSGKKLRSWLGVTDEEFYESGLISLVPMDFYYPGKGAHGDLPPRKGFAELWHPKIREHMPEVELVILVGDYSHKYYLKKLHKGNLTNTVQAYREFLPHYFPLVHPSPLNFRWLSKNPWFESEVIPVLRKTVARIFKK